MELVLWLSHSAHSNSVLGGLAKHRYQLDGVPSNSIISLCLMTEVKENGLPFWVPGVLCQHLEVVLWKLLSAQMIFWWIYRGESGLLLLLLHQLLGIFCGKSEFKKQKEKKGQKENIYYFQLQSIFN